MKKTGKRLLVFLLVAAVTLGGYHTISRAASVSGTKKKMEELENKKKKVEQQIKDLEKEKDDILTYVKKLDAQMSELEAELDSTQKDIDDTEDTLELTKQELEEAKAAQDKQYDNMKSRIQFMYENGGTDYVDILLSSESFSDLLNRTEYIEKISEYDNSMFDRFVAARELVEEKEAKLETELQELEDLKAELEVEQESVNKLMDAKKKEMAAYEAKIDSAEGDVKSFTKEIEEQEELLEKLLEEERKKQEEAANSGSLPNIDNTQGGFRWPLGVSGTITCGFGPRKSPTAGASSYHKGIDIGVASGTPIYASAGGTVVTAGYSSAEGNYVMIYHGNSTYTVYMHCSRLATTKGTTVKKGDLIAYVGSTGISTGPHLHFGISIGGTYKNPMNYVSR